MFRHANKAQVYVSLYVSHQWPKQISESCRPPVHALFQFTRKMFIHAILFDWRGRLYWH